MKQVRSPSALLRVRMTISLKEELPKNGNGNGNGNGNRNCNRNRNRNRNGECRDLSTSLRFGRDDTVVVLVVVGGGRGACGVVRWRLFAAQA